MSPLGPIIILPSNELMACTDSLQLYELQGDSFGLLREMSIHQPQSASGSATLQSPLSAQDNTTYQSDPEPDGGSNPPPSYEESVILPDSDEFTLSSVSSRAPLIPAQHSDTNTRRAPSQSGRHSQTSLSSQPSRRSPTNHSTVSNNSTAQSNQNQSPSPQYIRSDGIRITVPSGSVSMRVQPIKNGVIITGEPSPVRQSRRQHEEVPTNDSKRRITPEDKEILATHVGDKWRKLARLIGVPQGTIDNIRVEHERDQRTMIVEMLEWWYRKYGHKATINHVIKGLLYLHMYSSIRALPHDQ